jgi:hypothetical protein
MNVMFGTGLKKRFESTKLEGDGPQSPVVKLGMSKVIEQHMRNRI